MLSEAHEFEARVRHAFEGSPYVVTTTDDGFRVDLDIVDARWYQLLAKAGLKSTWRHDVKIKPGRYSITDRSAEVRWKAGVPTASWSKSVAAGTIKQFKAERTWAFDEHGNFRRVVDYRFNSYESRQALRDIGDSLGLKYTMNSQAKAGLIVGIAGAGLALVVLLVLGIIALAGGFG